MTERVPESQPQEMSLSVGTRGDVIIVDDDGGQDYQTISEAVAAANPGDIIRVWAGTYNENVEIEKTLTLIGNGTTNTTINGRVRIKIDWVNVSGFWVTNSGSSYGGIQLENAEHCWIKNNNVSNNGYGILLSRSNNNIFENNTCENNTNYGIHLSGSDNNIINNNTCENNTVLDIMLHISNSNTLTNNVMVGGGIRLDASSLEDWSNHTIDTSNTVNNKPVYYWTNTVGGTVPHGAGQIILVNCAKVTVKEQNLGNTRIGLQIILSDSNTIIDNICNSNYQGILLEFSNDNTLDKNTCNLNLLGIGLLSSKRNNLINNTCDLNDENGIFLNDNSVNNIINNNIVRNNNNGIWLTSSDTNSITNNTFKSNKLNGIHLVVSHSNNITNNTFSENGEYGAYISKDDEECTNNNLCHNDFINNNNEGVQAKDEGTNNSWDNGNEGNYWSDYEIRYPLATNYGNVWDRPYEIDGTSGELDDFPFVYPIGNTINIPDLAITSDNITFSNPNPVVGEAITINATVSDVGYSGGLGINKTFGGNNFDMSSSVIQTSNGEYIIIGNKMPDGGSGWDLWLIKTDSAGNEEWNKIYGKEGNDFGQSVQQTSDGGYIITGQTSSYGIGNSDVWLIKTDDSGNEVWNKTFGGSESDEGSSVQLTSDGGYIIAANTRSYGAGNMDAWLIKTDNTGNEEWNRTFGGIGNDYGKSAQQTLDGYIIIGDTQSYDAGYGDVWLIKTDSLGNEKWNKTFGGTRSDQAQSIQQTSDEGLIIIGYTQSYGGLDDDVWLIKTNESGHEEWNKTYGGSNEDRGQCVQETSDDGYIITGSTMSYGAGDSDVWLIKTDTSGNKEWSKTFGGSSRDYGQSVQQTTDGDYIIVGYTEIYEVGDFDIWLMKTDGSGNINNSGISINGTTSFYDGDPDVEGTYIAQDNITINGITPATASIEWTPTTDGTHDIYVKIDNITPRDIDLTNNIAYKTINVSIGEKGPHLKSDLPDTFSFDEDTSSTNLINLTHYFEDTNIPPSPLSYFIIPLSEESNIISIIEGHFISFSSSSNWSGTEIFQVNCTNDLGLSVRSNIFNVTVTPVNDPPVARLLSPGNGYTITDTNVTLLWDVLDVDDDLRNISFDLYLGNSESPDIHTSDIYNLNITITDLEDEEIYYWYVKPNDGEVFGDCPNGTWNFTLNTSIPVPEVYYVSPSNGATINTTSITLTWEVINPTGEDLSFDIHLGDAENNISKTDTTNSNEYLLKNLEYNRTYYWKVIPFSNTILGRSLSGVWNFTVRKGFIPNYTISWSIDKSLLTVKKGQTLTFNLTINNTGNNANTINVGVTGVLVDRISFNTSRLLLQPDFSNSIRVTFLTTGLDLGVYPIVLELDHTGGTDRIELPINITSEASSDVPFEPSRESDSVNLFLLILGIILLFIILVVVIMVIKKRRSRKEDMDDGYADSDAIEADIVRLPLKQEQGQVTPQEPIDITPVMPTIDTHYQFKGREVQPTEPPEPIPEKPALYGAFDIQKIHIPTEPSPLSSPVDIKQEFLALPPARFLEVKQEEQRVPIEELFLITPEGLLVQHYSLQRESGLNEDVLASMLSAVRSFILDSLAMLDKSVDGVKREVNRIDVGEYSVMTASGKSLALVAISAHKEKDVILGQIKKGVDILEEKFGKVMVDWDGDMSKVESVKPYIESLVKGEFDPELLRKQAEQTLPQPPDKKQELPSGLKTITIALPDPIKIPDTTRALPEKSEVMTEESEGADIFSTLEGILRSSPETPAPPPPPLDTPDKGTERADEAILPPPES